MLDTNFHGPLFCGRALARWTVDHAGPKRDRQRQQHQRRAARAGMRPLFRFQSGDEQPDEVDGAGMGAEGRSGQRRGARTCRHRGRSLRFCDRQARSRTHHEGDSGASNRRAVGHRGRRAVSQQRPIATCPWRNPDYRRRRSALNSGEGPGRLAMMGHQRREIDPDRRAVDHTPFAGDHHPIGAMRAAQYQRGERILSAAEARLVERE